MKETARQVILELGRDYTVTLVSGGKSGNCKILMCDRLRGNCLTLKLRWEWTDPVDNLAGTICSRLHEQRSLNSRELDRRPVRGGPVE